MSIRKRYLTVKGLGLALLQRIHVPKGFEDRNTVGYFMQYVEYTEDEVISELSALTKDGYIDYTERPNGKTFWSLEPWAIPLVIKSMQHDKT